MRTAASRQLQPRPIRLACAGPSPPPCLDSLQAMHDTKMGPDAQVQHPTIETLMFPPAVPGMARAERRYGERVPVPPLSGHWLPAKAGPSSTRGSGATRSTSRCRRCAQRWASCATSHAPAPRGIKKCSS